MARRRALMPRVMEVLYIVSRLLPAILITGRGSRGGYITTVVHQRCGVAVLYSERPRLQLTRCYRYFFIALSPQDVLFALGGRNRLDRYGVLVYY